MELEIIFNRPILSNANKLYNGVWTSFHCIAMAILLLKLIGMFSVILALYLLL